MALEDRLKQRLTGAAILVALVVLIVPEMFKGHPAVRPAQLPLPPNGAPVRSVTLNLDERAPSNTATVSTGPGEATQGPPTAASSPEAVRAQPVETAAEGSPSASSATQAPPPVEHVAVAEHVVASPGTPARGSAPAAHAPTVAAHAAPPAGGGKVGWTVQLGSFQQSENAHRMAQKLATKGVKTLVVGPDARGYYRVRTPEVADMAAAESVRERLLTQGFKGVIGTTP